MFTAVIFGCSCAAPENAVKPRTETSTWEWNAVVRAPIDSALLPRYSRIAASAATTVVLAQTHSRPSTFARPDEIIVLCAVAGLWHSSLNLSMSATASSQAKLEAGASGVIHAVWGERTSLRDDVLSALARPTEIEYRAFQNGEWSAREIVYSAGDQPVEISSAPVEDANGGIHIVWNSPRDPELSPNSPAVLYRYRSARGSWGPVRVIASNGGLSSIAVDGKGALLVAYVGVERGAGNDLNSVFVTRSTDGGRNGPRQLSCSDLARTQQPP